VIVRILAIYAAIGLGLAVGGILVMWVAGAFDISASSDDLFGSMLAAAIGAFVIVVSIGFALLVGVVIAATTGIYAASRSPNMMTAVRIGALGAAGGHVVLVVVVGVILTVVVALAVGFGSDGASDPFAQQRAECERVLGAGHPSCQSLQGPATPDDGGGIPFDAIAKLTLGIIPSALTGGLAAGISFSGRSGHT
jgi:hypothetical protein